MVQGLLRVPRDAAAPQRLQDQSFYSFMVDGEVLRKDELFEHFRYRFSLPEAQAARPAAGGAAAEIPLVFQRYLRPGAYTLGLKLEDPGGTRFFRAERALVVPAITAEAEAAAAAAAATEGAAAANGTGGAGTLATPPPGRRRQARRRQAWRQARQCRRRWRRPTARSLPATRACGCWRLPRGC